MQKLIVLDRDGVINEDSDAFVKNADEWIEYPTSIQAIARLTRAGYTVAVATNQSGIAVATSATASSTRCTPR